MFDLENLTPEQQKLLETQAERLVGFTPGRAAEFLAQSYEEHPEKSKDWHIDDATGKFKHFLRVRHGWGGIVDAAWPHLHKFAREVVEIMASTID